MSISAWVDFIKEKLECPLKKTEIRRLIIEECTEGKFYNCYRIHDEAIWEKIIQKYSVCKRRVKEMNIDNTTDILSWYDERRYLHMRGIYGHTSPGRGEKVND